MSGRFWDPRLTRFVFPIWKVGMVYREKNMTGHGMRARQIGPSLPLMPVNSRMLS